MILSVLLIMLSAAIPACASGAGETKGGKGSALQNISVFHEYGAYRSKGADAPLNCSTWGGFELESGGLPLDRTVKNGNKKAYRVNSVGGGGGIMFPLHGWASFSLEQYYQNGVIEFDLRGAAGGEDFSLGLCSDTRGVARTHSVSLSSQNIRAAKSWQKVKIPIKDIAGNMNDGFSLRDITFVVLHVPAAVQFYLSEMYISSPDREKQYPVIKVNQIGYEINQPKYALVSCFPGSLKLSANTGFDVVNTAGEIKFSGKLRQVAKNADPVSGELVYRADFSALNESGSYLIRIAGMGVDDSFPFIIGGGIYGKLLADAVKYFYFQRQGLDLDEKHAQTFARKNLHPGDRAVKKYSQRNTPGAPVFDLSQGWYDAGDFGKYFPPAASTVDDLLFAYELFPQNFSDGQLNIPESGNGAPDILDEIKWELDMMLKMEDGSTGSFYEVANYEGETIYIIDTNGADGAGNIKSTAATAWAAGVFAHAYIVYKDIPLYGAFARRCLETAERAWAYLENNPHEYTWVSGAGRGYYHDRGEIDRIKFLAAAALHRASALNRTEGGGKYQKYVVDNYLHFNYEREFNGYQVVTTGELGTGFIHYAMAPNPNEAVMRFFRQKFAEFETLILRLYEQNPWPNALVDWAYFWGSSKPIARIPVELYICNKVLNRDTAKSLDILRDSANYILGINPLSFSFVSGYGENSVKNIFSGIYSHDGIDGIPKGYLAGGANQYESGFMSRYAAKCYVDSDHEWTTNEHAIYWNAALVLCLAALL
ncbi:MAG: glycoside hydrolase family 9 protein [Treponema sp.]|jgi:hypothetical protein|nr:glycoside hydrolase family 9 protein [Treponema sp.]